MAITSSTPRTGLVSLTATETLDVPTPLLDYILESQFDGEGKNVSPSGAKVLRYVNPVTGALEYDVNQSFDGVLIHNHSTVDPIRVSIELDRDNAMDMGSSVFGVIRVDPGEDRLLNGSIKRLRIQGVSFGGGAFQVSWDAVRE